MTDAKLIMCILLYCAIVTLVINDYTGDYTKQLEYRNSFENNQNFSDFRASNLTIDDLPLTQLEGNWEISTEYGLHPTNLKLVNPLYWLPFINEQPVYRATCLFGKTQLNSYTYSEAYYFNGLNTLPTDELRIMMAELKTSFQYNYRWNLLVRGSRIYVEGVQLRHDALNMVNYEIYPSVLSPYINHPDNLDFHDISFLCLYDTGYDLPDSMHEAKISYSITLVPTTQTLITYTESAIVKIYVNDVSVYQYQIYIYPLNQISLINALSAENIRDSRISTNSLNLMIYSNYVEYSVKKLEKVDDTLDYVFNIGNTLINIVFFNIPDSVIPKFLQFIFFGIFDLGIFYIIARLLRGGG